MEMPMAELFQKKRLIEWDEEEQRRRSLEGHVITAWWVHNSIEMEKDKHMPFLKFLQMYGVIDTPTKEQSEWDRARAIGKVHHSSMFSDLIATVTPARRRPGI